MAVSDKEQSARRMNRNVEGSSGDQVLVVQVPCVDPWRSAAYSSGGYRRGDPNAPKERMERYFDAVAKARDHSLLVQRDYLHARIRKIFGQETASGAECVVGIGYRELDGFDADL